MTELLTRAWPPVQSRIKPASVAGNKSAGDIFPLLVGDFSYDQAVRRGFLVSHHACRRGEIHTSNIEAIFPSSPSRGGAKRQVSVLDPL